MNVQEIAPVAKPEEVMHSIAANSERTEGRSLVSRVVRILGNRQDTEDDGGLSVFLSTRAHLLGIAYRILKSAADAEDLVQDVWIRWQTADRRAVRDAAAFLATITRRLAINVVGSARSRRESSFGPSLPESADTCPDPRAKAERSEKLRRGVLVLLEKLSPPERAAYVLREAFDYSYREIANILQLEEANARQLVTRARQHVAGGQRSSVNPAEQQSLLAAFLAAGQRGALAKLESFLVGHAGGTVSKGARPTRTIAVPIQASRRRRWSLVSQFDAKVA